MIEVWGFKAEGVWEAAGSEIARETGTMMIRSADSCQQSFIALKSA